MKIKNNKGAALVEMALMLLPLMLIVFGIFEYGRVMYMTNALNNAAREGARRAAVSPAPVDVNAYVASCIPFDAPGLVITTTPTPAAGSGGPVTVTVTLPFLALTGIVPVPDNIRGEATMRYEL